MANQFLDIGMITNEALRVLENNLTFAKYVNREYDASFAQSGAKIGDTLLLRKPPRFTGRSGASLSTEDVIETKVPLTIGGGGVGNPFGAGAQSLSWFQFGEQFGVDFTFTTADLTLAMDDFSDRYLKPAMARIANRIDEKGLSLYKAIANSVGTQGVTPSTALTWLQSGSKLDDNATPRDGNRAIVMNPDAQAYTVDGLKGLFQSAPALADQYDQGNMGNALGYKFSMDQNANVHTVGPLGGTPLVNGASQGASSTTTDPFTSTTSLITDGWTASASNRLKAGDVITIAGVNGVNPQSKISTGKLQQFVVTADVSSDGSGNLTAAISPAIITAGPYQTVSGSPADNAAITVYASASTTSPQNLAFHKDAFTLATADLIMPQGVDMAARKQYKGISLRIVRQYAISTDTLPCRIDVLYGWAAMYPQLACRVWG